MRLSFTLPTATKLAPTVGAKFYTINIDRSAPKLNSLAILTRTWVGGKLDERRLRYNNVFETFAGAKAARADFLKALASHK